MNRTAATAYLTGRFPELSTETGVSDYSTVLDMALRDLGYAESDLATADVAQSNVRKYLALLDYYALQRFLVALSTRVSVSLPGPASAQRNQAFSQVQSLFNAAKEDLADLGIDPGSASSFEFGRINLDYLEPSLEVM